MKKKLRKLVYYDEWGWYKPDGVGFTFNSKEKMLDHHTREYNQNIKLNKKGNIVKKKTYGGIKLNKEANDRIKELTKKQPNLYYTTKPMKPQIKSILIVIIGAILSALFITMMCFGIKLIIEGIVLVEELKSICVSC